MSVSPTYMQHSKYLSSVCAVVSRVSSDRLVPEVKTVPRVQRVAQVSLVMLVLLAQVVRR